MGADRYLGSHSYTWLPHIAISHTMP